MRRFFGSTQLLADALARELVGRPEHVEVSESVFSWPLGRAAFNRRISGGGAFMDRAPHVLDLLHLLFGELEVVSYEDDATGGVESPGGRPYAVAANRELSRRRYVSRELRKRRISSVFIASGAVWRPTRTSRISFAPCSSVDRHRSRCARSTVRQSIPGTAQRFCAAVRGEAKLPVSGHDALPSVRALVACYAARRPLAPPAPAAPVVLRNAARFKKVLITGAAGAVGSRLVERFATADRLGQLRCVVRSLSQRVPHPALPDGVAEADLTDAKAVRRAIEGCDAIVHLAVGDRAAAETRPLVEAARELRNSPFCAHRLRRGLRPQDAGRDRAAAGATPLVDTGEPYADQEAAAERMVLKADFEAIVLRPHMVYGPWLRWKSRAAAAAAAARGAEARPVGLVQPHLRRRPRRRHRPGARRPDSGFGQPLFVTDGAPLKWSEYIDRHAQLVDDEPAIVDAAQFGAARTMKQWLSDSIRPIAPVLRSREVRNLVLTSPLMQATALRAYVAARDSQRLDSGGRPPAWRRQRCCQRFASLSSHLDQPADLGSAPEQPGRRRSDRLPRAHIVRRGLPRHRRVDASIRDDRAMITIAHIADLPGSNAWLNGIVDHADRSRFRHVVIQLGARNGLHDALEERGIEAGSPWE